MLMKFSLRVPIVVFGLHLLLNAMPMLMLGLKLMLMLLPLELMVVTLLLPHLLPPKWTKVLTTRFGKARL